MSDESTEVSGDGETKAKKKAPKIGEVTEDNIDSIFDALAKSVDLKPVNLQRGALVENSLSSGSLALDLILGGGWPAGRWSVAFGPEGGGKSTLSFFAMAAAVKAKIPVFHIDAEGAADPSYMNRIGLKTDWSHDKRVYYRYFQPTTGEQVFRMINRILKALPDVDTTSETKKIQAMFVIDSLPFLQPERRYDNDESSPMAQQAKMYADNINLIKAPLAAKNCILYAVNQIRLRPGVSYGSPEYEPCGETPKHASDLRLRISKRSNPSGGGPIEEEDCWDKNGTDRYVYACMRTIKNKMFSPFRETWMRIWFEEKGMPGRGIDPVYDTYQYLMMTSQLVEKKGYYTITVPGWEGETRYTWEQFKALILDPKNHGAELDIRAMCRAQFATNDAFTRYFSASGGQLGERKAEAVEEVAVTEAKEKKAATERAEVAEASLVVAHKTKRKAKSRDAEAEAAEAN